MIRTQAEYRRTKQQVEDLRHQVADHRQSLAAEGDSPEEIQRQLDPMISFCEQMADEVALYERIVGDDVPPLDDLAELGYFLIATRIARGVTQRTLAQRLNVHESMVSRDEGNDYHGITANRAGRILKALGVRIHLTSSPEIEGATVPTALAQSTVATDAVGTVARKAAAVPTAPSTTPVGSLLPSGNTFIVSPANEAVVIGGMIGEQTVLASLGQPVPPHRGQQAKMNQPVWQGAA